MSSGADRRSGRTAAVVGGGIGGLAAAVALQRAGWAVTVFEQSPAVAEVSAGLSLMPNAVRAVEALGLGDEVQRRACSSTIGVIRSVTGRTLIGNRDRAPSGAIPVVSVIERGDLAAILLCALRPGTLICGAPVDSVSVEGDLVHNGDRYRFDLVVGADGIASRIRSTLWPDAAPPRDVGITAWRWIVDEVYPSHTGEIVGTRSQIGILPLLGGRSYIFASCRGAHADVTQVLGSWPHPVPDILDRSNPASVVRTPLVETSVPARLWEGKVALLGDAAHGIRPHLGQGAALALEDAVTLGHCAPDLAAYSRARRSRVRAVSWLACRMSRALMPGVVGTRPVRDLVLASAPDRLLLRPVHAVASWQPPLSRS